MQRTFKVYFLSFSAVFFVLVSITTDVKAYLINVTQVSNDVQLGAREVESSFDPINTMPLAIEMEIESIADNNNFATSSISTSYKLKIEQEVGDSAVFDLFGYYCRDDFGLGAGAYTFGTSYQMINDAGQEVFSRSHPSISSFFKLTLYANVDYMLFGNLWLSGSNSSLGGVDISSSLYFLQVTEAESAEPVPEPATVLLFGAGLFVLAGYKKRT